MIPEFSEDVLELLGLLAERNVEYVIAGGIAVNYYGYNRTTGDIYFFYRATEKNTSALYRALEDFFDGPVPAVDSPADFLEKGIVVQYGGPPNRVDFINEIENVSFEHAWKNRVEESFEQDNSIPVYFLDLDSLIDSKKQSDRPKDLQDLEYLMQLRNQSSG